MKKINFNDRYGLTQAVIEGRKIMTRRIIIPQPDFLSDNFGWAKRNNGDVILPKYGVGEVVAVAQSYEQAGIQSWAYLSRPEIDGYQIISTHKGWRNKMYVRADLMPHQIRITGIKCERLQDISDEDCFREGISESWYESTDTTTYGFTDEKKGTAVEFDTPREAFASLIDRVSGKGTWKKNPWVVAYEFELLK
jgi:hypothetical protein